MFVALSYGMVSELYPEALRPRVFSMISGMWGTAALLGPTVGGIFAAIGWWRGAFWVATPVIIGLMGLAWCTLPPVAGQGAPVRLARLRRRRAQPFPLSPPLLVSHASLTDAPRSLTTPGRPCCWPCHRASGGMAGPPLPAH